MKDLKELLQEPNRLELIEDCVHLIDSEVKSKKGFGGAAVKAAYALVKAIKPRIIPESVDGLLDEFTEALQPYYLRYQEEGSADSLESWLNRSPSDVAESLLAITDRRADRAKNRTMVKAYRKLRPKGKVHVEEAIPGIGRVLDKHVPGL